MQPTRLYMINSSNHQVRSQTISLGAFHNLWLCVLPFFAITPDSSFSGITAQALESVTTTLADVQAHLRTLITPSTILLGHSLESDLRALQLSHPRCIDTALIFHHPRGRPLKPGLAWLTRKWLGRTIQDRGPGGHDHEEDARACVDLLKARVRDLIENRARVRRV
jgi:DNA polymerase III epsilon subunit-like protein